MAGSRGVTIGVCAAASALLLAGCGSRPADTGSGSAGATSAASGAAFNACMVLDTGGVDDKSFNQSSWAGMQAASQANPNIKISYVPSNTANDYTPNLTAEANKKCDTTIAVGGLMSDNVKDVASQEPVPEVRRGGQRLQRRRTSTGSSSTPRRAASSAATSRRA